MNCRRRRSEFEYESLARKIAWRFWKRYRVDSWEDLYQTIWYLLLHGKGKCEEKYLPNYVTMKLKSHLTRGEKLPGTLDLPFNLKPPWIVIEKLGKHEKADTREHEKVLNFIDDPIIQLLRKGMKLGEVAREVGKTVKEVREHLAHYRGA